MIGAALALIVLGVILLFVIPMAGLAAGIVGVVLAVIFLLGFGRHPARRPGYVQRRGSLRS
jgi:uncharacterized membrane protein